MTTILVIEDETTVRENIIELLEAEDFIAIAADNGKLGLQLAQQHQPNLILCDIMMPELDGYGVLTHLRRDQATSTIPFIFLSSKASKVDLRQGMNLGADDYLTKPFTPEELLKAIETRLQKQSAIVELQQQLEKLQHISLVKDETLTSISHDLRAPLANMSLIIHLLETVPPEAQRNKYLDILQTECDREIELVNHLLELQRLNAATYPLCLKTISLRSWLLDLTAAFESRTVAQQQTLMVRVDDRLPNLDSDPISLGRIVTELLNNACKYTLPGGSIILEAHYQEKNSSKTPFCLTLHNEAEIPATELPHIFDPFYRISNSDFHGRGGTGLGLAVVKKLVEKLQGTLQVESQQGWTTFTLRLPATPSYGINDQNLPLLEVNKRE